MDRRTSLLLAVAAIALVGVALTAAPTAAEDTPECEFPLEVVDATGETVSLDEPPERIVTTAPSAAQTLWELDVEDRVVGVSMHAGFLDGAAERANVSADPMHIDIEAVVDLEPDLVIAPDVTLEDDVDSLRQAGLTVYQSPMATSLDDIIAKTETKGALVGDCAAADAVVDELNQRLDDIDTTVEAADGEEPLVYYTMGTGAFEPGEGTFQHEALERAGTVNLLAAAGYEGWAVIDEEEILEHDPDWILYSDQFDEPPITEALEQTTAYQEGQVASIDAQNMSQPAPRIIDAIESIHETVYDEVSTTPEESSNPIPGFSVAIVALAAGLLALIISRRR